MGSSSRSKWEEMIATRNENAAAAEAEMKPKVPKIAPEEAPLGTGTAKKAVETMLDRKARMKRAMQDAGLE